MNKIIVEISPDGVEGVTFTLKNKRLRKRVINHLKEMGVWRADDSVWLWQWDMPVWVNESARKEIDKGYCVSIKVDAWEALHLWGYDSHTLVE